MRNVDCISKPELEELLGGFSYERLQMIQRNTDMQANLAVVYFNSEEDLARCFYDFRQNPRRNNKGNKVDVSMKFTTEPAIKISNVPDEVSEDEVRSTFGRFSVESLEKVGTMENGSNEYVAVLATPKMAKLAKEGMNKRIVGGNVITVEESKLTDSGWSVCVLCHISL